MVAAIKSESVAAFVGIRTWAIWPQRQPQSYEAASGNAESMTYCGVLRTGAPAGGSLDG
jgi:hypothetical protein